MHRRDISELGMNCLRYLCSPELDIPPPISGDALRARNKVHPFYIHASCYVLDYISDTQMHGDRISILLQRLFQPAKTFNFISFCLQFMSCWLSLDDATYTYYVGKICTAEFHPLHAASALRLAEVCQWLLAQDCDVNQGSALGSPLECLFQHVFGRKVFGYCPPGFERTLQILLEAGASCTIDGDWITSLGRLAYLLRLPPQTFFAIFGLQNAYS